MNLENQQKTMSIDELNQILMQFGHSIGLENFSLDENAATSLMFDDRFLVELQALDRKDYNINTLYFIAQLCEAPKHKTKSEEANFYQQLLQSNLSGITMSGVSFAFDKTHEEILLISTLSAPLLTIDILEMEMEKFVNVLEHWSSRLTNGTLNWGKGENQTSAVDENQNQSDNPLAGVRV